MPYASVTKFLVSSANVEGIFILANAWTGQRRDGKVTATRDDAENLVANRRLAHDTVASALWRFPSEHSLRLGD